MRIPAVSTGRRAKIDAEVAFQVAVEAEGAEGVERQHRGSGSLVGAGSHHARLDGGPDVLLGVGHHRVDEVVDAFGIVPQPHGEVAHDVVGPGGPHRREGVEARPLLDGLLLLAAHERRDVEVARVQQGGHRPEVVPDQAKRHPGPIGDGARRRRLGASLGDQLDAGVAQPGGCGAILDHDTSVSLLIHTYSSYAGAP